MAVAFDPLVLVAWIFLSAFLPGILLALALFKKSAFGAVEKIFIGCALGWVVVAAIPFLLFLFGGIAYSTEIAWASIALFYLFSIGFFVKEKAYDGWKRPSFTVTPALLTAIILILLLVLNFWARLQTYSPMFYELDPYFYTFGATQLLTLGEMPFDDATGWYPEARSSHRAAPLMIYLEAVWYSLYTGGGEYDNYLLSVITSVYPAIAAALALFFLYLFVRSQYGAEAGLLAAGIAGFIPIFFTKTLAGEMEVQPYGFFAIAFFLAMYAWAIKTQERRFAALAGFAYAVIVLGSSSQILALATLIVFLPLQGLLLFAKGTQKDLRTFIEQNAIVIAIGPLFGELLKNLFVWQSFAIINTSFGLVGLLAFVGVLYYLKEKITDKETALYAVAGLIVAGAAIVLFTPLGGPIRGVIESGLDVASYSTALQRTIAEQGVSGTVLEGQLGFLAWIPKDVKLGDTTVAPQGIVELLFAPFSLVVNTAFGAAITILNGLFSSSILYESKVSNLLFVFIFLFAAALLYALYRAFKYGEATLIILFLAALFPASLIGILKAKFTLFTGFFMAGALGVILGEAIPLFRRYAEPRNGTWALWAPLGAAALLILAQYGSFGLPHALLITSSTPRFQDDPVATQASFSYLCEQIKLRGGFDSQICSAAADPVGYASLSTNHQYNARLCMLSLVSDPNRLLNGPGLTQEESWAAQFRCQRINDYWIESMEWIAMNTEPDARVTSWWDYGHWTNLFGQRNTVLRNEHLSLSMIGEVAHGYISGTPEELASFMRAHDSKYALFDQEILFSGGQEVFGGKYGALNYLACNRNNRTSVAQTTGISECESEYLWELIYVPQQPTAEQVCLVSEATGQQGTIGYYAVNGQAIPIYCITQEQLPQGTVMLSYYLDTRDESGMLLTNRGLLRPYGTTGGLDVYTMLYTNDPIWMSNESFAGGYDDHKGKFYESNLYRAFVLEELPGFEMVFKSANGEVKIFKLKE